ncbi:MAG: glycosyltransferase family protein [Prolixibacteraceae bacterium]|jgi:spore coat polysaccharide biosynthesis protein SpsF|nr:glycosyltransferase family protein [Prolixibacteraceae bacterium]
MSQTSIIIQARTGSTRMPQKVVLPFYDGKSIIEILLEKLLTTGFPIVLATTDNPADNQLVAKAEKYPIGIFRGSEENVLARFIGAAKQFQVKNIVRVCADNPFLDAASILVLAEEFAKNPSDYLSFQFSGNRPSIKTHFGFFAEMTTLEALQKAASLTSDKLYIEHVTNYLYGHPQLFNVRFLDAPEFIFSRSDIRLTLDTPVDFSLQQKIYAEMKLQNPNFDIDEVVAFLDKNPELLQQMKLEIDKNSK